MVNRPTPLRGLQAAVGQRGLENEDIGTIAGQRLDQRT